VVLLGETGTAIIIYDAFSPNGDTKNDVWNIGNISQYPNCKVKIINAWGNQVFSSDGYPEPWDGTYNGNDLPSGTYYYFIDLGDGSDPLTGPVNIVK
jgi:gliding motility-associated-like protein